ncbi:MAG: cytochrome c [bacterium]|nr:cytochrome c [bacterium]
MSAVVVAVFLLLAGEWAIGTPAPVKVDGPVVVSPVLHNSSVAVVLAKTPGGKAYIVDAEGIVRRIGPAPATAEDLERFFTEWADGKVIFENRCARCHGSDGMDTGYPYISQLGGIGRRLTILQIRAKLHPTIAGPDHILVRGDPFTAKQFEALLTFLAGL